MDTRRHIDDLTSLEVCERVRQLDRLYLNVDRIRRDMAGIPPQTPAWNQLFAAMRRMQRRYEALRDAVRFD